MKAGTMPSYRAARMAACWVSERRMKPRSSSWKWTSSLFEVSTSIIDVPAPAPPAPSAAAAGLPPVVCRSCKKPWTAVSRVPSSLENIALRRSRTRWSRNSGRCFCKGRSDESIDVAALLRRRAQAGGAEEMAACRTRDSIAGLSEHERKTRVRLPSSVRSVEAPRRT